MEEVPLEHLQACYRAFLERRLARGSLSIRTKQGFERLRRKYLPRLQYLREDGANDGVDENVQRIIGGAKAENSEEGDSGGENTTEEDAKGAEMRSTSEASSPSPPIPSAEGEGDGDGDAKHEASEISEPEGLWAIVGVYFDPRVRRCVHEICWPLAHYGGQHPSPPTAARPPVPEWQELERRKYAAWMARTLRWLFPGLPDEEIQDQTLRDWRRDCEFDGFGTRGLSLEGFMVSLMDLAGACTDGSVAQCLEFLGAMSRRLETALPMFPPLAAPTEDDDDDDNDSGDRRQGRTGVGRTATLSHEHFHWRAVPLERLVPFSVGPRSQFFELKAKLATAPLLVLLLVDTVRDIELQIATSAKTLVRELDQRTSVGGRLGSRNGAKLKTATAHFIETERQCLWTFRAIPRWPSVLFFPNGLMSQRTLSYFGSCRVLDLTEDTTAEPGAAHGQQPGRPRGHDDDEGPPTLTVFTAIVDPFPLLYGPERSLCGRIDRQSTKLFVIDHRERPSRHFKVLLKTSLIHNTSAGGGAGAATALAAVGNVESAATATCINTGGHDGPTGKDANGTPHSFVFIVRMPPDGLGRGPATASADGSGPARAPSQWFTTLSGANENKTIYVDTAEGGAGESPDAVLFYVCMYTLHGFYFEVTYEDHDVQAVPSSTSHAQPTTDVHRQRSIDGLQDARVLGSPSVEAIDPTTLLPPKSVKNSANLLRHLLLLRKSRGTSQPPPECVGGSKITGVKVLTAAATLRAKFLRARATDRRARFEQQEEEFRAKVMARLLRHESAKRRTRALGNALPGHGGHDNNDAEHKPESSEDTGQLETRASLLASFFKEMAAYQPTQQEMDEAAVVDAERHEQEESLLDSFADLFDDDMALQNILDAEKWMSYEEKQTRRKEMIAERASRRRQSLVDANKEQVPELSMGAKTDATPRKSSQRAMEDYDATADLIKRLMSDVISEEKGESHTGREDEPVETGGGDTVCYGLDSDQLSKSWIYAQRRTLRSGSRSAGRRTDDRTSHLQATDDLQVTASTRNASWMTSHYVTKLGQQERLQHAHATLRPMLVPSQQTLQDQEHELPWQPLWEVTVDEGTQPLGSPGNLPAAHLKPQPPRTDKRPMTAFDRNRPGTNSEQDGVTELQSATYSYRISRRIRSAGSGSSRSPRPQISICNSTARPPIDDSNQDASTPQCISHVPLVFREQPYSAIAGDDGEDQDCSESPDQSCSEHPLSQSQPDQVPPHDARRDLREADGRPSITTSQESPTNVARERKPTVKRRKRSTRMTAEEKKFAKRMDELLAITPVAHLVPKLS